MSTAQTVEAGAEIRANLRLGIEDCIATALRCPWLDFSDTTVLAPWAEVKSGHRIRARGAMEFRLLSPPSLDSLEQTTDPRSIQPHIVRLQDAWIGTRGDWLNLTIGADRIHWGMADGFSVVDRVNPWDFTDPTQFDQRLSVPMAHAVLHRDSLQLDLVAVPFFQPAALPSMSVDLTTTAPDLFDAEATGAGDMQVGTLETRITTPGHRLSSSTWASRLRWTMPLVDVEASYSYGPDSMPQVDGDLSLVGFQTNQDRVDIAVPMRYPHIGVAGLAVRTELPAELLGWAEVTLSFPEQTIAQTNEWQLQALLDLGTITEIPDPLPQTVTQDGEPYLKGIGGVSRQFGAIYVQAQWLHGFPTERQRSEINDYFLFGGRWSITPTVKLDVGGVTDFAAWMGRSELAWLVADSAEFQLGLAWIDGDDHSSLTDFSAASHVRSSVKMAF